MADISSEVINDDIQPTEDLQTGEKDEAVSQKSQPNSQASEIGMEENDAPKESSQRLSAQEEQEERLEQEEQEIDQEGKEEAPSIQPQDDIDPDFIDENGNPKIPLDKLGSSASFATGKTISYRWA